MGVRRRALTWHFSTCCSQWSESLHRVIVTHQQSRFQELRYCQENHPDSSCSYDLSKHWFSCRWFQWRSLALSPPRQYRYYWRSIFWLLCFRRRAHHHGEDLDPYWTIWWTSIVFWSHLVLRNSGKLANMAIWSTSVNSRFTFQWPKLPSWDVASFALRWLEQQMVPTGTLQREHSLQGTTTELYLQRSKNVTSASYWETTRSHLDCATTCASWFPRFPLRIVAKWPDKTLRLRQIATCEANFGIDQHHFRWAGEEPEEHKRLRSIHRTRIISISNDSRQDHGYHLQIASLRWTSSWRSICLHPSKNGRCSQIIENSKFGVSRHLDSSTTTQMAKIMVFYRRPSCSFWTELEWSSFGRTIMGKAIWENPIEARLWEGVQIGNDSSHTVKKEYPYLCMWMTSNWLVRNKTLTRCGKYTMKNVIWENEHLCWIMCSWAALNDNVKQAKILWTITEPCLNREFPRVSREITILSKSSYFFMVLWCGWSCKEVCRAILSVGKQDDSSTIQSI